MIAIESGLTGHHRRPPRTGLHSPYFRLSVCSHWRQRRCWICVHSAEATQSQLRWWVGCHSLGKRKPKKEKECDQSIKHHHGIRGSEKGGGRGGREKKKGRWMEESRSGMYRMMMIRKGSRVLWGPPYSQ